jgi:hypothetical protein
MRHPTWFYIVIAACAVVTSVAAADFARSYRAATWLVPLSQQEALDTRTGQQCFVGPTPAEGNPTRELFCGPFKGRN